MTKQHRSPSYPCISLPVAIQKAFAIYQAEGVHPGDPLTLVKAIGYSSLSGTAKVVLSAVKKYGLLEKVGENYKLSNLAIDILSNQEGSIERVKAIKQASLSPPLFEEFYNEFGESLPSENNIQSRLLKRGFNAKILPEAIEALTETWDMLKRESQYIYNTKNSIQTEMPASIPEINNSISTPSPIAPISSFNDTTEDDNNTLIFRIAKNSEARIVFDGKPTQESIDKLIALLQLSKDTFPTQKELEQRQVRTAVWKSQDVDIPVKVMGEYGIYNNRKYMTIEGSTTGVPEDELEYLNN